MLGEDSGRGESWLIFWSCWGQVYELRMLLEDKKLRDHKRFKRGVEKKGQSKYFHVVFKNGWQI